MESEKKELESDEQYTAKVIKAFTYEDGSIIEFPAQLKKQLVIFRHCLAAFEPGKRYTEPEVNAILKRFHPDVAFLRRSFIVYGMMDREGGGGAYWRIDAATEGNTPA